MSEIVLESVLTCPHCGLPSRKPCPRTSACFTTVQQFKMRCAHPWRLLRVLLVWLDEVPTNSAATRVLRLVVVHPKLVAHVSGWLRVPHLCRSQQRWALQLAYRLAPALSACPV